MSLSVLPYATSSLSDDHLDHRRNSEQHIPSNESRLYVAIRNARAYLTRNAGRHVSVTNTGVTIDENFAQCLIQELTNDESLVNVSRSDGRYNYFKGRGQLTTEDYPDDLDTTAIAITVLGTSTAEALHGILDEMLQYRNDQGVFQVYFDKSRTRIDPVVCLNASSLYHKCGRGSEAAASQTYAYQALLERSFLNGSRYYHTAEAFLYFANRFVQASNSSAIKKKWIPLLRVRLVELRLLGKDTHDPLAAAMRVLLSSELEMLPDPADVAFLLDAQSADGCWRGGWYCRYGVTGILVENPGLTTALAIAALAQLLS